MKTIADNDDNLVAGFVFLSLNGQERSERSERVVQFSSIMPTVWPIAFAAILGNSIKWYTYWRLEHSIELQVYKPLTVPFHSILVPTYFDPSY